MKICISTSAGGHLDQMLQIFEAFEDHDTFFVTIFNEVTSDLDKNHKVHYVRKYFSDDTSSFKFYIFYFIYQLYMSAISFFIILKERPDLIICNGGQASLTLLMIGKIFGVEVIYLESLTRTKNLSGRGKVFYKFADLFLVQWDSLSSKYERAKYWGKVI